MLAMLGLLPLDNIVEEEKNKEIFPTEINYITIDDTLTTCDSSLIKVHGSIPLETTYFHVLHSENMESPKLVNHEISQDNVEELKYIILYLTN